MPGPIVEKEEELIREIISAYEEYDKTKVEKFNRVYNEWNDGEATKRLVDLVIGHNLTEREML